MILALRLAIDRGLRYRIPPPAFWSQLFGLIYLELKSGTSVSHFAPASAMFQTCCADLLCSLAVQTCCAALLCRLAVQPCCADLLCGLAVQTCCAALLCSLAVQPFCADLLCSLAVQTCCAALLCSLAVLPCCAALLRSYFRPAVQPCSCFSLVHFCWREVQLRRGFQ